MDEKNANYMHANRYPVGAAQNIPQHNSVISDLANNPLLHSSEDWRIRIKQHLLKHKSRRSRLQTSAGKRVPRPSRSITPAAGVEDEGTGEEGASRESGER